MNYTYIVKCSDASLYTGWTTNLDRRMGEHNSGRGAKYTRSRVPVELVYYESFLTKQEAMRREWEIKQLSRREKLQLIETDRMVKGGRQQTCPVKENPSSESDISEEGFVYDHIKYFADPVRMLF